MPEPPSDLSPDGIVASLYRSLLGRDPDEGGLRYFSQRLGHGTPLEEIVSELLNSTEFRANSGIWTGALGDLPANPIELELPADQRQALWNHVATVWNRLGQDDPYWSVLSSDEFRIANMSRREQIDRFYDSGRQHIDRVEKQLARHQRELPENGLCVDYGCGLGRTTLWLARRCRRVLAVDVSAAHLARAREALATRGVTNVEFRLVRCAGDLAALQGADFFHSVIVLQHSPPPVMAEILAAAFAGLNPRGGALFQVPTYGKGYGWACSRYLEQARDVQSLEMHVLPQSVIFRLAARAGCVPLEVQPDDWIGIPQWVSNTFIVEKPALAAWTG